MDLLEAQKTSGVWFRLAQGATFTLAAVAIVLLLFSLTQRPAPGLNVGTSAAKQSNAAVLNRLSTAG
jgi:hypothetical protein